MVIVANAPINNTVGNNMSKRRNAIREFKATHEPLYPLWRSIHYRCYNENAHNYRWYGGRGIKIYHEWECWQTGFIPFKEYIERELGPCPEGFSLDRIDSNGDYVPGNLKWASPREQALNKGSYGNKKYKGARWDDKKKYWVCTVIVTHIESQKEAAQLWNRMMREAHGERGFKHNIIEED